MNWLNVAILVLFILVSVITAYRLGKAVAVALMIYVLPSDMLTDILNEFKSYSHKKNLSPSEKLKWKTILTYCIRKFVF